MLIDNKEIAIVGGGPGGLTLARLLQLKGVRVRLYERDVNAEARIQGSPLDMHEGSGAAALHQAGLFDAYLANVRQGADKKIIVNDRGEVVYSDHEVGRGHTRVAPPEIDRGALRQLFLDVLEPQTTVWDRHFIGMEGQGDGWVLHFKNGASAYADLVVAADGAHSRIRPYLTDSKAFYAGFTMVEINVPDAARTVPAIHALLKGGKVMAFGHEQCILGGQKGEGGLGFYASFKPAEAWAVNSGLDFGDRAQVLAWFTKEYSAWSPVWQEILEQATMPVIPRRIYCMPLDQTWAAQPNLTMMGDAAHVMPPFAGEGANMSMLDALELSECLTSGKFTSVRGAIAFYEVQMRARAARAARQSLENGVRMHSPGALEKMLAIFGPA